MPRADQHLLDPLLLLAVRILPLLALAKADELPQRLRLLHHQQRIQRHRLTRTIRRHPHLKPAPRLEAQIPIPRRVDEHRRPPSLPA